MFLQYLSESMEICCISTKMPDFVIIKYSTFIKWLSLSKTKSQILLLWCRYSQFSFLQCVFLVHFGCLKHSLASVDFCELWAKYPVPGDELLAAWAKA